MGGFESKRKEKKCSILSDAQKANILKMLKAKSKEDVPLISQLKLQTLWNSVFPERILAQTLNYLFKASVYIKHEDLELFYYKMVIGTTQDRAQTVIDILSVDNSLHKSCFEKYVSDWLESYANVFKQQYPESCSINISGDAIDKRDVNIVSEYFVRSIILSDDKVDVEIIKRWLDTCVFMNNVLITVMSFVFNMDIEVMKPVLPRTNKMSHILSLPLVLALSYLVNTYMEKEWRLLFSSATDPHSWHILYDKVSKQGPTLVLIEDPDGQVFGGFASQSWKQCPTFYGDEACFIFRLRPEMDVFFSTGYNDHYQYMNHGAVTLPNGLGMGGQMDYFTFFANSDFGPVSVSKSSSTFRDYVPLASCNEFSFTTLEIWGIGKPDMKEENVRRNSGLIMERDPGAAAILEIIGKTGYSKNIPEPSS